MEEREEIFRDLCDNANDLIQSVSPDGRFLYVNHTWCDTLGYSRDELPGLRMFDIIHPDSLEHCQNTMARLLDGETALGIEADFLAKDGRRISVEGSASCRFENGKPIATRGIFRNVTERKQMRAELDRLFHLSQDLCCVANMDGYFIHINPAWEKVTGFTREELLNRPYYDLVHPDDRERFMAEIARLAEGQNVVDFQNRGLIKDGSFRWFSWRVSPLPERGLVYAIGRDITEEKRVQEVLTMQAEELARSNADLEQFAYAASHDLLSPLRNIANLSEWIEEDLEEQNREKAEDHLQKLRTRVRQMQKLTEDLLRYSKVGRESKRTEPVEIRRMIEDLTGLISPPAGFEIIADPGLPTIETTPSPLEQVFRNLISNAIKHHDRDCGRVTVSAEFRGDWVEFAIADDGPGIDPKDRERAFQMFQKLSPTDTSTGTGMGLALVKRIIESQGGSIRIENASPRGSIFRFTWPKKIQAPEGVYVQDSGR